MTPHRPALWPQPGPISRIPNGTRAPKRTEPGQIAIQIGGGGASGLRAGPRSVPRVEKPRQEICAPLKWTCFFINFVIFLGSVGCLALGLYLFLNDPRPIGELADVVLNPAVLLASLGLFCGVVALLGLFGALRDNVCLLRMFALFVFLAYLALVISTCLLFLLFYSDATGDEKGISAQSVLLHSIRRYHANRNVADFVDYLQEQLECCGSTSFRDWQLSEQFNCNSSNPYPERCGVPFSCCRRSVAGGANGGQHPLAPAIRSLQCWQNAQKKREQQLDSDIYVAGCLQPLRTLFDDHAVHIGLGVVTVIVPVCLAVFLSQCLARQIDYQRFLLRREQRRIARAERRERRYREHAEQKMGKKGSTSSQSELIEARRGDQSIGERRRSPPRCAPPPTPRGTEEANALEAAKKASKKQWEREERRRRLRQLQQRAASSSPLRAAVISKEGRNGGGGKRMSMSVEVEGGGEGRMKRTKEEEDDARGGGGRRKRSPRKSEEEGRKGKTKEDEAEGKRKDEKKKKDEAEGKRKDERKKKEHEAEGKRRKPKDGGRGRKSESPRKKPEERQNDAKAPVEPRVTPSAPPLMPHYLTLQQSHFN